MDAIYEAVCSKYVRRAKRFGVWKEKVCPNNIHIHPNTRYPRATADPSLVEMDGHGMTYIMM